MMQYTLFLVLAPIAFLAVAGALVSAYRVRTTREVSTYVLLLCAVEGWLVCNFLELAAGTERWTLFWAKATYLFISTTPVAWLAVMVQYAGKRHWLRSRVYWFTCVIPALTLLLVWTNESHHLVWQDVAFVPVGQFLALNVTHGPWFLSTWLKAMRWSCLVHCSFRSATLATPRAIVSSCGGLFGVALFR